MRTTLTIEDDIAVEIEALRRSRRVSLKAVVNDALRKGLSEMSRSERSSRRAFKTRSLDAGALKIPGLDNISDALAIAEGEDFR